ncbi:ribosomal-processing cysteine protease Prp [Paenibacillus psychroresistens]|uniref:Ribosomal processing cysteine protease Prp n=1 Tax=Paenibacillus psychroresistens TaxID=1778678 RepID=A0A6B8RH27_9BACL|nr:ribosomal-processing cysteine protease Prp [Paenibacillus psychroresistens]QGQ95399.1 ribosomal-processing cysteine protease Prp [Paenibacillus psychroresistens]
MIRVTIERLSLNDHIHSFKVKGHAMFADPGQDIVCAGVSAVTVGTVNAVEALLGFEMQSQMKDGFLQAEAPGNLDSQKQEKLQLLLESMVVMLQSIETSYGNYIKVKQSKVRRR